MEVNMSFHFSPSEFNFLLCKRCYYLKKVKGLEFKGSFPEIFNTFDLSQKKYFLSKDTHSLSKELPKGDFFKTVTKKERDERIKKKLSEFNALELPGKIYSAELKDKKDRIFTLGGIPDLVVKFDDSYGILDFKTTGEKDKTQNYKFQLESYALIFENPKIGTPKLSPVKHMGLIQFTPKEIKSNNDGSILQNIKMQYFKLERNQKHKDGFLNFITNLIDILEKNHAPFFDARCNICNTAREVEKI